ncbi:alcohol dehydrogenase zinc-binding domain protein, partial [mine drainage metagenome]
MAQRAVGSISDENFQWAEGPMPVLREGEYLARNLWFSFGPTQLFMLGRTEPSTADSGAIPIGEVMRGEALSRIVESRHPDFRPGELVIGQMGWEDYSVSNGAGFAPAYRAPDGVPP